MTSVLAVLAAVNPVAVALALWPRERPRPMAVAALLAWLAAVVAAGLSGPILDGLDVSPGTMQVAAAIVLGLVGARWLVFGARSVVDEGPAGWGRIGVPLLIPVLFTPQLIMVSLSAGADEGVLPVALTAAGGLALSWLAAVVPKGRRVVWTAVVRLVGAAAILLALTIAVDGTKTV